MVRFACDVETVQQVNQPQYVVDTEKAQTCQYQDFGR